MSFTSKNFIILEKVDSTNNYAMGMVQKGMANCGDAIFAAEQTAGKGRRNKQWKSNPNENIIVTILSQMQWLSIQRQFQLSAAVALACKDFFSNYIKETIKIKWPNDIFINDRKAGGILIENIIKGNLWQWTVIGVGLNINQDNFETEDFEAISLKNVTGKNYEVIPLARQLHFLVLERIEMLKNEKFNGFLEEYNETLYCRNHMVKLKKENITFETTITGVSETGQLITNDMIERRFQFDEIRWMGKV